MLLLFPPPIGSWESLVDVVAGSSPVGGTRSYCIPNRAGESQFPSVSPPEPTIGLSPRVRGNRSGSAPLSVMTRSIPACAGEPSACCFNGRSPRVYPRVCGGTDAQVKSFEPVSGLSPRVRGTTCPLWRYRHDLAGSIPACAGEPHKVTWRGNIVNALAWVYPRVCGGTRSPIFAPQLPGLSPRVRGNRRNVAVQSSYCGLSPRVRGNHRFSLAADSQPQCEVYPRVCGGTQGRSTRPRGLSPRVRGNRAPVDASCPQGVQVYPRVCGGTRRSGRLTILYGVYPRVCGGTLIAPEA